MTVFIVYQYIIIVNVVCYTTAMNTDTVPPAPTPTPTSGPLSTPVTQTTHLPPTRKQPWFFVVLSIILLLGLGGVSVWGFDQHSSVSKLTAQNASLQKQNKTVTAQLNDLQNSTGEKSIDSHVFQAVFLSNGQVYFGKITKITASQITLQDIFYLQGAATGTDVNNPGGSVSLVKLGKELHGPQDTMYLERKNVQFWENLKSDGQVSKAIATYEKQNPGGQ